jgi:hypothetical protein
VIIPVSSGQVAFEFCHLKRKLRKRDEEIYSQRNAGRKKKGKERIGLIISRFLSP